MPTTLASPGQDRRCVSVAQTCASRQVARHSGVMGTARDATLSQRVPQITTQVTMLMQQRTGTWLPSQSPFISMVSITQK